MTSDRSISAMIRLRNEEEFLEPAVLSIDDLVDEIVLVDNASTDRTPEIIETLRHRDPDRVHCYEYPHEVRKVGQETWDQTERGSDDSPHLSSSYYNFALERCTMPFVLKWDGDMVALDRLREQLSAWRSSDLPVMRFHGVNVHPDRRHRIVARSADREALLARLRRPALPRWATSLTYDSQEPRLFPRHGSYYESKMRWTQRLQIGHPDSERPAAHRVPIGEPCFLHMKFCKRDPLANYSPDLAQVIGSNIDVGPPLEADEYDTLESWGLAR